MPDEYLFMFELMRETGESLGRVGFVPDWDPAIEWTRWVGVRTKGMWVADSAAERRVEPVWHRRLGQPFVDQFRVHLDGPGSTWCEDFHATPYFADAARVAAAGLAESGILEAGDRVRYRVTAFPRNDRTAVSRFSFDAADAAPPLILRATSLATLVDASAISGDPDTEDHEAFVPQSVIDEATKLTAGADARETGGILIGHLHRNPVGGEIFSEVTAQIPARHTQGDALKLTFTSDTWTDVRAVLALRRRGELMLGWWHSHPAFHWCRNCPDESRRVCVLASGFLSTDDQALHRALFPRAFTQALLMTNAVSGISPALFGWRRGLIARRAFRVTGAEAAPRITQPESQPEAVGACETRTREARRDPHVQG